MELGKCRECDHEMSTTADACPNCGSRLRPLERVWFLTDCLQCWGKGYYRFKEKHLSTNMSHWMYSGAGADTVLEKVSCFKEEKGAIKCERCDNGKVRSPRWE